MGGVVPIEGLEFVLINDNLRGLVDRQASPNLIVKTLPGRCSLVLFLLASA